MKRNIALVLLLALAACQSPPPPPGVKIGKPYSINGKTYRPEYDPTYDETGLASWYGPGFHGGRTANGEEFDTHDLTAAHPTLPMPSLVRVTNLENGKALIVRINDRGPFAKNRIIDLSKAAAQRLGVKGLAKVRVQYLKRESDEYVAAVGEGRRIDMFAFNDRAEEEKNASIIAATAPSDQSFIIESSEALVASSEDVAGVAPVVSVQGQDLPAMGKSQRAASRGLLVRDAMADEVAPAQRSAIKESSAAALQEVVPRSETSVMIQIGSFSKKANAETLRARLGSTTSLHMTSVEIAGHRWWRLQAGPFSTAGAASDALQTIRAHGAPDARILAP